MLEVDHLSFSFQDRVSGQHLPVLQEFSSNFTEAEIAAIVGPSGCGKSTFLNVIAGILPPDSGTVTLKDGHSSRNAGGVGYVFQNASLIPWRTILENAMLGAEIAKKSVPEATAKATNLLTSYGIDKFRNTYPATLSGGMQQRVSLVRAIVSGAKILLLDEPFSSSDYLMRRTLQRDLSEAVSSESLIALFVTHDLEEAVMIADRIIVLSARPANIIKEIKISVPRTERLSRQWSMAPFLAPVLEELWSVLDEKPRASV
jgi:ABC-type nitrate/sulfonate/bicarbonate transport system ATPase subunit